MKPAPGFTWMLGNEEFTGFISEVTITEQPNVANAPGLKVEQTAYFRADDHLDVSGAVDFTCIATVYNSSELGNILYTDETSIKLSLRGKCQNLY